MLKVKLRLKIYNFNEIVGVWFSWKIKKFVFVFVCLFFFIDCYFVYSYKMDIKGMFVFLGFFSEYFDSVICSYFFYVFVSGRV